MPADEILDIVDENDVVLFQTTKTDCYERGLRPRIVNIAVIDPETKNIAIQVRGQSVSWQPLHYCISACGHVGAGEAWDVAASRELEEELGIATPLAYVGKTDFTDTFGDNFMLGVYMTECSHAALQPSLREVSQVFSLNGEEIGQLLAKNEKIHNLFPPVIAMIIDSTASSNSLKPA